MRIFIRNHQTIFTRTIFLPKKNKHAASSVIVLLISLSIWVVISRASTYNLEIDLSPGDISSPLQFTLASKGEAILHVEMSANTNWSLLNNESAVVSIYVDGDTTDRNQDIVLFNGEQLFTYRVALGRLEAGEHFLQFSFDQDKSSSGAMNVFIKNFSTFVIDSMHVDYDVYRFSPILYGRNDNFHTDTPLLMWHEIEYENENKRIRYSVVWSNEDGGTSSPNLMSRWGRTTDIEWIYDVKLSPQGSILMESFQGPGHKTTPFQGNRLQDHPILRTATQNNMVSDSGTSDYKFFLSPERTKLVEASREIVMDMDSWTYKIMTQEMINEGKYENPADPFTIAVSDARNYLFLEFNTSMTGNRLRLVFGVKPFSDSKWYYSDHNDKGVQSVNKPGWRRTTIELPAGTPLEDLEALEIRASANGNFSIAVNNVSKIFMLSDDFTLVNFAFNWNQKILLNPDTPSVVIPLSELTQVAQSGRAPIPADFELLQNYPNPLRSSGLRDPETKILIDIREPRHVVLRVFNILGEEVKTLVNSYKQAGRHVSTWDATDNLGRRVSNGVYFYSLEVGEFRAVRTMLVIH